MLSKLGLNSRRICGVISYKTEPFKDYFYLKLSSTLLREEQHSSILILSTFLNPFFINSPFSPSIYRCCANPEEPAWKCLLGVSFKEGLGFSGCCRPTASQGVHLCIKAEGWIPSYAESYYIPASPVRPLGLAHSLSDFANNREESSLAAKSARNREPCLYGDV